MMSPPGWTIFTSPKRARIGPSMVIEARSRVASSSGTSAGFSSDGSSRTVPDSPSTFMPNVRRISSITPTSLMSGTLWSVTGSVASRQAGRIANTAFLLPPTVTVPSSVTGPSMTNSLTAGGSGRAYGGA